MPNHDLRRDSLGGGNRLHHLQRPTIWIRLVHREERLTFESFTRCGVLDMHVVGEKLLRIAPSACLHQVEERLDNSR